MKITTPYASSARKVLVSCTVLSFLGTVAFGATPNTSESTSLDTIYVIHGENERVNIESTEGATILTGETLEDFGSATGNLTDSLDTVTSVQFGEDAKSVEKQADIRPLSISISGGRPYENNFVVDGLSNNSRLDPAGNASNTSINDIPGHDQRMFISTTQIDSVTVYDNNIPAEFGRFTGGVIDAKLKKAKRDKKTSLIMSGTSSSLNSYHVILKPEDPDNPTTRDLPKEPEFERNSIEFNFQRPFGEISSVRGNLNRRYSKTPKLSLGKTEYTEMETIGVFASTDTVIHDQADLQLSFSYSPFELKTQIKDVKDSELSIQSGGMAVTANVNIDTDTTTHKIKVGLSSTTNKRQAAQNFRNWANTRNIHWGRDNDLGSSRIGGFGDLEKKNDQLTLNWHAKRSTWLGKLEHKLNYGVQLNYAKAGFDRPEPTAVYTKPITNTVVQCLNEDFDCLQNEQYFSQRKIYPKDNVDVSLLESSVFIESTIRKGRLKATVGFRADNDNFLKNFSVGWRTRANFDVFNNQDLFLTAGMNRYYGGALLTYKIREASQPFYEEYRGTTQNIINVWEEDSGQGSYKYRFDNVKTPYSDELTLGAKKKMAGGTGLINLTLRENKDEFSRTTTETQPDGYRYYLMNNDGESNYKGLSISWSKVSGAMNYGVYARFSETESSNKTYDDEISPTADSENVWHNDTRKKRSDIQLLRQDYARPVTAGFYVARQFKSGIRARFKTRIRGKYDTIVETKRKHSTGVVQNPDGTRTEEFLTVFEDKTLPISAISDLTLSYRPSVMKKAKLNLTINNLFNSRTHTVAADKEGIEAGRSLWLGINVDF